jgi:LysR family transcriptional regulator, cell division regulator
VQAGVVIENGTVPKRPEFAMDVADLKIFEAVARLGAMNRAAGELNTVQSNVTARVRQLEAELGAALFHRHPRGVTLTDAGRRLLPFAMRMARLMADARRAIADEGEPRGALTIGALESTAALRLPPILSAYAARYPDVDVSLHTGTTCELITDVLAHRLEGALVCGPVDHADLAEETVFSEELVILAARAHRSVADITAARDLRIVVLRAGCSYRERLEAILARRGVGGVRRLEFGTLEAIVGCVRAGLGITLMPRGLVNTVWRNRGVSIHELPPDEARVDTTFIRRRDAYQSGALAAFMGLIRPALMRVDAAE